MRENLRGGNNNWDARRIPLYLSTRPALFWLMIGGIGAATFIGGRYLLGNRSDIPKIALALEGVAIVWFAGTPDGPGIG